MTSSRWKVLKKDGVSQRKILMPCSANYMMRDPRLLSNGGLRGGAGFAAFAGAMHAKRALAQSCAREFGKQGVHVAHVVIDGPIDTPFVLKILGEERYEGLKAKGGLLLPEEIAESYWSLHQQKKSAWTHELDRAEIAWRSQALSPQLL